jgi:hypothetical protein
VASLVNIPELERQITAQETEVAEAAALLDAARKRLTNLLNIRNSAMHLGDIPGAKEEAVSPAQITVVSPSGEHLFTVNAPLKKKIRSTQIVVDMVREEPLRWWSRQQIQDAFRDRDLIPETWDHPSNAINNAIARAVEKTWIVERSGNYGAPSLMLVPPTSILDIEVDSDD